jgi:hypothetical protein
VHGFDGAGLTIGATPNQIFDWIASSNRGKGDPDADDWIIAPTARIEPGYPSELAPNLAFGWKIELHRVTGWPGSPVIR